MALGKKTGGRDFKKGQGGRSTGSKDRIARGARSSIKAIYESILARGGAQVEAGIEKRLLRGDFQHTRLAGEYLDGKPVTRVEVGEPQPLNIVMQQGGRCAECGSTRILPEEELTGGASQ